MGDYFDGNVGPQELTTDEWVWDANSGKMVPSGRKTTRTVDNKGTNNVVTPVQLGGLGRTATQGWADQWGKQTAPWRNDFTNGQQAQLNDLKYRSQGLAGPSAAENQLLAQNRSAGNAQMALANSARGSGNIANAGYNAQQQIGLGNQQTANQQVQLQAQQQQQATNQYAGALNLFRGQNAQQTMADAQRQADMVKFYTQLGFDEQQAQLLANQQTDQMNADVWASQNGFKTQADALEAKRKAASDAETNQNIDMGISLASQGLASFGGGK